MSVGERLKQVSDRSLAIVAVSIFLAGVAAAVTTQELRIRSISDRHDAELARLASDANEERAAAEAALRDDLVQANDRANTAVALHAALEDEISKVRRTVGAGEQLTLDLTAIVVDERDLRELPAALDAYADDLFALPAGGIGDWSYRRTTSAELLSEQIDVELDELFDPAFLAVLETEEVHAWQGDEVFPLSDEIGPTVLLRPSVTVARSSIDDLRDELVTLAAADAVDAEVDDALRDTIAAMFAGDPVSGYFQLWVAGTVTTNAPSVVTVLESIQRAGDALYVELADVYTGITLDGEPVDRFFNVREVVILKVGDDILLIETSVPTPDRRTGDYSTVTRLLESIRVVD